LTDPSGVVVCSYTSDANSEVFQCDDDPGSAGVYWYVVKTYVNGSVLKTTEPVRVEILPQGTRLAVYPNPVPKGAGVQVDLYSETARAPITVKVFNVLGQH